MAVLRFDFSYKTRHHRNSNKISRTHTHANTSNQHIHQQMILHGKTTRRPNNNMEDGWNQPNIPKCRRCCQLPHIDIWYMILYTNTGHLTTVQRDCDCASALTIFDCILNHLPKFSQTLLDVLEVFLNTLRGYLREKTTNTRAHQATRQSTSARDRILTKTGFGFAFGFRFCGWLWLAGG